MLTLEVTINEQKGEPFQTEPLAGIMRSDPHLVDRLARISALIRTHFLSSGWEFRVHSGSLTFQGRRNKHHLVKILVDSRNRLSAKAGVYFGWEPIAVGVELTYVNHFVRECIRDRLNSFFGEAYLDPRKPRSDSLAIVYNDKYWIIPHTNHYCDIIFVKDVEEMCRRFPVESNTIKQFSLRICRRLCLPFPASSDP